MMVIIGQIFEKNIHKGGKVVFEKGRKVNEVKVVEDFSNQKEVGEEDFKVGL